MSYSPDVKEIENEARAYTITNAHMIGKDIVERQGLVRGIAPFEFLEDALSNADKFLKEVAKHLSDDQLIKLYAEYTCRRGKVKLNVSDQRQTETFLDFLERNDVAEDWVQFCLARVFTIMETVAHDLKLVKQMSFTDKSKSSELRDLHSRAAKIDFVLVVNETFNWGSLVLPIELKKNISAQNPYYEAIGQVFDRFTKIGQFQSKRKQFYGVVGSSTQLEFFSYSAGETKAESKIASTEKMKLRFNDTNKAFRLLCGMFLSSPQKLGYDPPVVPTRIASEDPLVVFKDFRWIWGNDESPISCKVVRAERTPVGEVVVKAGAAREKEVAVLKCLTAKGVTGIPCVIDEMVELHYEGLSTHGFTMTPLGSPLPYNRDFAYVLGVLSGVLSTLIQALRLDYLHADISIGNIIVSNDNQSLLVDWQHSVKKGDDAPCHTIPYSSMRILTNELEEKRCTYRFRDSLESLFYVAVDLLSNGVLIWKPSESKRTTIYAKGWAATFGFEAQLKYVEDAKAREFMREFQALMFHDMDAAMDDYDDPQLVDAAQNLFDKYRATDVGAVKKMDVDNDG